MALLLLDDPAGGVLLHENGDRVLLEDEPTPPPEPVLGQLRGYVVVLRAPLNGTRQRLGSILTDNPALDVPLRQITLMTAASLVLFARDAPDGFVVAPNTRLTLGPFSTTGPLRFSDLEVLGIGAVWVMGVTF